MPQAQFPENQALLDALTELSEAFRTRAVPFWLRGGWGLDFLLGQETRPHGDLDVVVWNEHRDGLPLMFGELGFTRRDRGFRAQLDFVRRGVKVSVILLERQPNGDLTPFQSEPPAGVHVHGPT